MGGTRIYAVPLGCYSEGFLYRRDAFQNAGLDPDSPPATLEDWWHACQRLTAAARDGAPARWALCAGDLGFQRFFLACGAEFVAVDWLDAAGTVVSTSRLEDDPAGPLARGLKPRYRAVFDSPQAAAGLAWIWKFRWQPWVRDSATGEPHDLTEEEAARTPGVMRGVLNAESGPNTADRKKLFDRGTIAMMAYTIAARAGEAPPENAGMLPFPALHAGDPSPSFQLPVCLGLNSALVDPRKREAAWRWISYRAGPEAPRIENDVYVQNGMLKAISTYELRRAGMLRELAELPRPWREAEERIFAPTACFRMLTAGWPSSRRSTPV
jgi:ABC-type glycerol-3-phosphate transport system substrate-binding protein